MRLTIIVPDGVVGIDGEFRKVDLTQQPVNVRAVQWDGAKGHVEYEDGSPNTLLSSIKDFDTIVTAWNVLTPPPPKEPEPPTLAELAEAVREALQIAIDTRAHNFGFSGGNALMLYAGFANPFQPLAQVFATWEASVWYEAEQYKAEVLQGKKPMLSPTEAVALMPVYPL